MRSKGIAPNASGAHFARTLPKPIPKHGRLLGKHAIPLRMLRRVLLEVGEKIVVIVEAIRFVEGCAWITQAGNNFAGFFCQHFGRILSMQAGTASFFDSYPHQVANTPKSPA